MHLKSDLIRIFIINLRRSGERRSEMIRKMDLFNFQYEFFDAVDGKELDVERLNQIKSQPYSFKKAFGREMTTGEIGCAMSHLNVYKKIVDEKIEIALILEDDIDFDERIQFVLKNQKTTQVLENDLDLVLLGYSADGLHFKKCGEVSVFGKKKIGNGISFCIPTVWNWLTIGYFISKSGAQKLLTQGELPRIPADFLTANSPKYKVRLGITNRPLVWPGELSIVSQIGTGRGHSNEIQTTSILNEKRVAENISIEKKIYRNARSKYHKMKRFLYSQLVKVHPKDYLFISDKF